MTVISVKSNKKNEKNKQLIPSYYHSVFGTAQVMVGLFSIGLGPGRTSFRPNDFADVGAAYCLGVMFAFTGAVTLFSDRTPGCSTVYLAAVNALGSILAVTGIALYFMDIETISSFSFCPVSYDSCPVVERLYRRILIATDVTLLIFTVLQLAFNILLLVPISKTLIAQKKEQGGRDAEISQADLKEALVSAPQD